mmetsp:Transcript_29718/g.68399  ORF Transcript_29718/g.68399 Transcript_29718/m.68399 type:complete len:272 (-) Transcript_29718:149-964(-)
MVHLQTVCIVTLPALLAALSLRPPRQVPLGLVEERKWNWKEAVEETKTEWAIVLKRYVLADVTLFDLQRHFSQALPAKGIAGLELRVDADELQMAGTKLGRLSDNLERAVLDQNTSDVTAVDMQSNRKSNHLSTSEKVKLHDTHKQEQMGFFAVEASGQHVLQQASALYDALVNFSNRTVSQSWGSLGLGEGASESGGEYRLKLLSANVTEADRVGAQKTLVASAAATQDGEQSELLAKTNELYEQYQQAARSFHLDLGNFEALDSKAIQG